VDLRTREAMGRGVEEECRGHDAFDDQRREARGPRPTHRLREKIGFKTATRFR
jgi:hypothetical protein